MGKTFRTKPPLFKPIREDREKARKMCRNRVEISEEEYHDIEDDSVDFENSEDLQEQDDETVSWVDPELRN